MLEKYEDTGVRQKERYWGMLLPLGQVWLSYVMLCYVMLCYVMLG
jgi:hypothetical protein